MKKLQEMQKGLFGEGKQPSPEQRDQFRQAMRQLTPDQRRQLQEPMREQMAQRMNKMVDGYFALPPEKRKQYLDKQIQEGEKRRKEWEQRRQQQGAGSGQGGQGQNPGNTAGGGANRPGWGPDQSGQGQANGGPGGRGPRTPQQRAQHRNQRLDHTTPEQRAKWTQFRDDMRKRRLELGLPANPWGNHGPRAH